jgi:hypothetical protein
MLVFFLSPGKERYWKREVFLSNQTSPANGVIETIRIKRKMLTKKQSSLLKPTKRPLLLLCVFVSEAAG